MMKKIDIVLVLSLWREMNHNDIIHKYIIANYDKVIKDKRAWEFVKGVQT